MARITRFIKNKLLGSHLDFRVRLFNVLAMAGIVVSLAAAAASPVVDGNSVNFILYLASSVLATAILWYSTKSGRYQLCYLITIIAIFMIGFPAFFFMSGVYYGTMGFFFVFAVVFTVFMLEGVKAIAIAASQLLLYAGVCIYAYYNYIPTENDASGLFIFRAGVFGFVTVSIALGFVVFMHFRLYNRQQAELEESRKKAEEASEAKSRFLANMSHEIRTPINVMLSMNEVILRDSDDPHITDCGRRIGNAGQTLLTLISNILDVAAIEKGKLEIKEERYETAMLVAALCAVGEVSAPKRGLTFHVNVDERIPKALSGDMARIRHIVTNFIGNAVKFTHRGGVTLSFSVMPAAGGETGDKAMLRIAVADTGIGMEKESIPHIFGAFTRMSVDSGEYVEGSGLGLAIANEYAGLMGGRIEVDSTRGEGSVFTLELMQKVCDSAPIGRWESYRQSEMALTDDSGFIALGCSMLVVDDSMENLFAMKSQLSRTMMRVDIAAGGAECLEAAKKSRYDIILMDYMMPGMDGVETLRRLQSIPGFDTPVIALTANVVAGIKEELMGKGFAAYLPKPAIWRDLKNTLTSHLPESLVTEVRMSQKHALSDHEAETLAGELSAYGIGFSDGLRYMSGDVALYGNLCGIFCECYSQAESELVRLAALGDWAMAKHIVHSLKSRAKAIGAGSLSETAAKLEALCEAGDGAYITAALPVLCFEWERAYDGLMAFTGKLSKLLPAEDKPDVPAAGLNELLGLLKVNRQLDALDAIDLLLASGDGPERQRSLREIRQKVDEVEFAQARRLLEDLLKECER